MMINSQDAHYDACGSQRATNRVTTKDTKLTKRKYVSVISTERSNEKSSVAVRSKFRVFREFRGETFFFQFAGSLNPAVLSG